MHTNFRQPSYKLTFEDAVKIWQLHWEGHFQNRIAAKFDVNPGRISEVINEHTLAGSKQAALKKLNDNKSNKD